MSMPTNAHEIKGTSRQETSRPGVRDVSRNLASQVRAEQVRILYRQIPAGIVVDALLGALLVVLVGEGAAPTAALVWYALVIASGVNQLVLWLAYRRASPAPARATVWNRWYVVAVLCTGMAWGSGSIFLLAPASLVQQLGVTATVVCLAAAVIATTLASMTAIYAFLVAAVMPYAVFFALQGTLFHEVIAALIAFFVIGNALLARDNSRIFTELIALRFDVAAQRDAAELANLAKSKFLAAASHDLRQPLHAMTLLADALVGRLQDPDDRLTLARLHDSLAAMRKLFNALLDVSRLDAGIVEPQVKDVQLSRLLARLQSDYEKPAREKNIEWRCPPTALIVRSDPVLLETMLSNLISNAIRYTPHGYIAIACHEVGGQVRIEIEDSGVGIARDQQTEIFREFHQLNNPERDGTKGLGLGLAIVERLAHLLDHRIELRSAPGEGSCFTVVLPLGSAAPDESDWSNEEAAPDSDLVGMVVLVIDDQASVLEGMQALLGRWGCEVMLADSEETALAVARRAPHPPELIIADYRLREDRTGSQAIDGLRREFGTSIPALIVTGDTAPERLREVQSSGLMLMNKPVPPGRLRAFLRTVRRNQTTG